MDFKNLNINELLGKAGYLSKHIGADKSLMDSFEKNPVKTLESKFGINLPDEQVSKLVDAVKAKLKLDKAGGLLAGAGNLFKK